jgi:hypothetical protein
MRGEVVTSKFKVLSWQLSGKQNHGKPSVSVCGLLAKIQFSEFKANVLIPTLQCSVQNGSLELNKHVRTAVLTHQSLTDLCKRSDK